MNYSLGNMLGGSNGSLNPDKLSLNLQFATDKTLTARKGPTPVFTRASTATFVGSDGLIQSAAINAARFDHDPSTLVSRGLLIEESRTNNVTRSQEMNLWSGAGGSTRAVSTENSPDGTTKATLASGGSAGFGDLVARSLSNFTSAIGTQYTVSCFVKKINYRYVAIDYAPIRLAGAVLPFFDLDTLVFSANGSTVTGSITAYPNGWYRLTVSGSAIVVSTSNVDVTLCSSAGTAGSSRLGQQIYLWGAQLETGAFPTSYIPTTTASVVRSVDICSITGSAFTGFYNASAGTAVIRSSFRENTVGRPFSFNNGSTTNTFEAFNGTQLTAVIASGGTTQYQQAPNTTMLEFNTFALAAEASSAMAATNGTLATAGTGIMPVGIDRLNIGNRADGARILNGHIASLRYYKKRLPNAKLQTLTT